MEWIKDYPWVVAAAFLPVFYWAVSQLARPLHWLVNKYLPEGELKDVLTNPDYEEKKAADPDVYKRLRRSKKATYTRSSK